MVTLGTGENMLEAASWEPMNGGLSARLALSPQFVSDISGMDVTEVEVDDEGNVIRVKTNTSLFGTLALIQLTITVSQTGSEPLTATDAWRLIPAA